MFVRYPFCSTKSVYQIDQRIANPGSQNQWFVQQILVDVLSNKRTNEQITKHPGFISFVKQMWFVVLSNKWTVEQTTNSGHRCAFHVLGGRRGAPRVRGDAPRIRRMRKPMVPVCFICHLFISAEQTTDLHVWCVRHDMYRGGNAAGGDGSGGGVFDGTPAWWCHPSLDSVRVFALFSFNHLFYNEPIISWGLRWFCRYFWSELWYDY